LILRPPIPSLASPFSSGAVTVQAIRLEAPVEIDLPGPLVALSFISAMHVGPIRIEEEDDSIVVATLHSAVAAGQFKFLLKNVVSTWRNWGAEPLPGPRRVKLTPLTGEQIPRQAAYNMIAGNAVEPLAFPYRVLAHAATPPSARNVG
jgi:hypothetical protein